MTDAPIEKTASATATKTAAAAPAKPAAKSTAKMPAKPAAKSPAKPTPKVAAKPATAKAPTAPLAKKPSIPAPKPVAVPAAATALKIVPKTPQAAAEKAAQLKMKDLIERVVKATGGKKKGVKEIIEATLTTLGDALSKGEAINLPGFGRAKVAHAEDKGAGKPMTIKMKSQPASEAKKPVKLPLAAPQD